MEQPEQAEGAKNSLFAEGREKIGSYLQESGLGEEAKTGAEVFVTKALVHHEKVIPSHYQLHPHPVSIKQLRRSLSHIPSSSAGSALARRWQVHAGDHSSRQIRGPHSWRQPPSPAPPGRAPWTPPQDWPGHPPHAKDLGGWQEAVK